MIDNQEKVHTQLHKFDKIICENINDTNVHNLYCHSIEIHSDICIFALSIINESSKQFTTLSLRQYLYNKGYTGGKIYPAYGYIKSDSSNIRKDCYGLTATNTFFFPYYIDSTYTIDSNAITITRTNSHSAILSEEFYKLKIIDTINKL